MPAGDTFISDIVVWCTGGSLAAAKKSTVPLRSPWSSGGFYLFVLIVATALACAVARLVPLWTVPVVLIAGLIALTVVGAFQLRHDDRLSEHSFLKLMALAFRQLPFMDRLTKANGTDKTR